MSLKYAILVLLESEPSSGYDLAQQFKRTVGNFWTASHQQIYLELKKLSTEGLISCTVEQQFDKPNRKVYTITESGAESLQHWINLPVQIPKVNDALLVKIYSATSENAENLKLELAHHSLVIKSQLQRYLTMEQKYLKSSETNQLKYKMPYMTLRRGILMCKGWLTWSEEMMVALDDMMSLSK